MALVDRQVEYTGYLVAGFPNLGLRGWALAGACAVTGNATQENLCKPVTSGQKDHGSDGSLQWRDSPGAQRLTGMQSWCVKNFGDWKTLEAQAAFTLYETARDYPALDAELRTGLEGVKPADVRSVLDYKTKRFQDDFERPNAAMAGLENRQKHAASVYMIMSGKELPKPQRVPPVVAGGGVVVAGGAAAGGVAVANGGPNIWSAVLFTVAVALAVVVTYLTRPKTVVVAQGEAKSETPPIERMKALLEQRAIINAEIAETADAIRDSFQAASDLLVAAGEPTLTIEHQAAATAVLVLGEPTTKA